MSESVPQLTAEEAEALFNLLRGRMDDVPMPVSNVALRSAMPKLRALASSPSVAGSGGTDGSTD